MCKRTVIMKTFVWSAYGGIEEVDLSALMEAYDTDNKKPDQAIEKFDNGKRTVSSRSQFMQAPSTNLIKTRDRKAREPLFKFQTLSHKKYELNIAIQAKTVYKYKIPVLCKYYVAVDRTSNVYDTKITSSSSASGPIADATSVVWGSDINLVVDTKATHIKINVTFRVTGAVNISVFHGISTDDPEAELYCLDGSFAVLTEV